MVKDPAQSRADPTLECADLVIMGPTARPRPPAPTDGGRVSAVTTAHDTVAVVTGAARGFGREIARRLVARGHRVLITDLDPDAVTATAGELGVAAVPADAR